MDPFAPHRIDDRAKGPPPSPTRSELLRDISIRNKIIRILYFLDFVKKKCHGARTSFQRSQFLELDGFFLYALDTFLQGIYVNQRVEIYRYILLYSGI